MVYMNRDLIKSEFLRYSRNDVHLERAMEQMRYHSESVWIQSQLVEWSRWVLAGGYLTPEHRQVGRDLLAQLDSLQETHKRRMGTYDQ